MNNTLNAHKGLIVFLATLSVAVSVNTLHAANYLFFWKASTDLSVTHYGIYQRIGDSDYVKIDQVRVRDLDNPAAPSYLATGLSDGNTYWFAATSISSSGTEGDLYDKTCITVNDQVVECSDDDDEDSGSFVYISCFITAAGM
jgi:hypothetical protein